MLQALEQKNIDAFIAWQPYPAQALQSAAAKVVHVFRRNLERSSVLCAYCAAAPFARHSRKPLRKYRPPMLKPALLLLSILMMQRLSA